jgi:hypothetical protein
MRREADMARRKYQKFDRYGNRVEDDDDILRDGERISVPLLMCDEWRRDMHAHLHPREHYDATAPAQVVDGFGNSGLALSKPGARYLVAGSKSEDHARLVTADVNRRDCVEP